MVSSSGEHIGNIYARFTGAAAAALALAALIAGCGSYTKADFVSRAQGICTSALRAERSVAPPSFAGTRATRDRSLALYLERELTILAAERRRLSRLPRPQQSSRNRARLAAYLSALGAAVADFHALAAAVASGRPQAASEQALERNRATSLAAAYGLPACASPGATER